MSSYNTRNMTQQQIADLNRQLMTPQTMPRQPMTNPGMGGGFGQPMPRQPMTKPGMGGGFGQPPMAQPQKPPSAARSYLDAVEKYKQSGSQGPQPRYTDFRQQPGMGGQPMTQPPMPPQLPGGMGGQPGGMDRIKQLMGGMGGMGGMSDYFGAGAMDPRMLQPQKPAVQLAAPGSPERMQMVQQLMGGMGGQPQQGGGMDDAYQQFLTQRQQPQQQGGYGPGISNYSAPQQLQQGPGAGGSYAARQGITQQQLMEMVRPANPMMQGGQMAPGQQLGSMPTQQPQQSAQPYQPLPQGMGFPAPQNMGQQQPKPMQPGMGMNMGGSVGMAPPNPYAQQVGQEDPRMQAMRNLQMMNFGG